MYDCEQQLLHTISNKKFTDLNALKIVLKFYRKLLLEKMEKYM